MELKVTGLTKIYGGKTVLDIPQLTLYSGQITGIAGNNGAGKTTMLRLLLDLVKADTGQVLSNNVAISESGVWKEYTGSYIDKRFLIPFYTPEEFFRFVAKLYRISKNELYERLKRYHSLMHDEILGTGKQIRFLSEGNQQKAGIIAAMVVNPQVLVLDEPFNYLDPTSQIILGRMIKQMNEELGTTIIISSHNLASISEVSSRILLLENGKIIKDICNIDADAAKQLNGYFAERI